MTSDPSGLDFTLPTPDLATAADCRAAGKTYGALLAGKVAGVMQLAVAGGIATGDVGEVIARETLSALTATTAQLRSHGFTAKQIRKFYVAGMSELQRATAIAKKHNIHWN